VTSPAQHEQTLRDAGLRVTQQRLAVLDAVRRLPHADTESLISAVRAETGEISHQAVYDVLRALTEARLIQKIQPLGAVARYEGRYGTGRVGKVVQLGSVTPLMLKTDENPRGTPIEAFDEIRDAVLRDRSQFFSDLARPFYGANRKGAKVSKGLRRSFWHQGMQCGIKSAYDCVAQFSETDFGEDLARIDVPTLVAHGDDDQIVPIKASALRTAKLVSKSVLKVYKKGSHGLAQVQPDAFNLDLLKFIES